MLATRPESFAALRDDWNAVLHRSTANTIFSTWEWQSAWWSVFGKECELHLLGVRSGREVIGIVPLVERGGVFSLVGGVEISDYLDVIAVRGYEDAVCHALLSYVRGQACELLDLHCLRQDSPTLAYLTELAVEARLTVEKSEEDVCPAVELPSDWDAYVASLGKKDRHELRRKLRRLEETGSYRWYAVAPSDGFGPEADAFLRLCRESRQEKAAFLSEQVEVFFRLVMSIFGPQGTLKLYFLEVAGRRVSAVMCFGQGQELWLYNSGFDPSYASLSVGLLLKAFCIQDAIYSGKRKFDFLRGREPYKYDLGGVDAPIFRLQVRTR
ncbi:MAG: GNAT family N-acetyltransferase [Chloroflexi bacterium]|nr:GNAT family N-acetyltransferase [Chloroflexota bacterium]